MLSTKDRKDFWMIPFTNQSGEGRKSENKKTKKKTKKKNFRKRNRSNYECPGAGEVGGD